MSKMIDNPAFDDVLKRVARKLAAHPAGTLAEAQAQANELVTELAGHDYAGQLADKVAIGADDCYPCAPRRGNLSPSTCFRGNVKLCDLLRTGSRTVAFAGGAAFTIDIQPGAGADYFEPLGARMWAHDAAAPSVTRWEGLFLTGILVGQTPQESFNGPGAAGTLDGVYMGSYVLPDWCHCPVGWAPFGRTTADKQLRIVGFSLWPVGPLTIGAVEVVGNAYDISGLLLDCCSPAGRCAPNTPGALRARYAGKNGNGGTGAVG